MQETWKTELTNEEKTHVFEKVIQICHANLFNENTVLSYLQSRGITNATARLFKLGSFPQDIDMLIRFIGKDALFQCGLLSIDRETKKIKSKFKINRLIIPIIDVYGHPISIIGRCLISENERIRLDINKYTNTFFKKSKCLFGLNFAKDSIRVKNKAYVVEGNFDVIMAYQHGMRNVVASSGAFLSKTQLVLLARYTNDIRLLLDNDSAGQEASIKILRKYKYDDVQIKASQLPSNVNDLDEYFRKKVKINV